MMDARRMEVYAAIYDARLHPVRETMAEIVTPESYASWLETRRVCFFGDGATKCQPVFASENAVLSGIGCTKRSIRKTLTRIEDRKSVV